MSTVKKIRKCLICEVDISHKDGKAKFCTKEHSDKYYNNVKTEKKKALKQGRVCELCAVDISNKASHARFCCRAHKEKHYRHLNRDKVREWKRNEQKRNKVKYNENRDKKRQEEREIYGYSKSYMREYARRHEQELIKLKGKKCFNCGIKQFLSIHHVKYTKDPNDWQFVCQICHIKIHEPTTLL